MTTVDSPRKFPLPTLLPGVCSCEAEPKACFRFQRHPSYVAPPPPPPLPPFFTITLSILIQVTPFIAFSNKTMLGTFHVPRTASHKFNTFNFTRVASRTCHSCPQHQVQFVIRVSTSNLCSVLHTNQISR